MIVLLLCLLTVKIYADESTGHMFTFDPDYSHLPAVKRYHRVLSTGEHNIVHSADYQNSIPHPKKRGTNHTQYVRLLSNVTHAPKWRFVCLDFEFVKECGQDKIVIQKPSKKLTKMLKTISTTKISHRSIVIHASPNNMNCLSADAKPANFAMFRVLKSIAVEETSVTFYTESFMGEVDHMLQVFSHADIMLDTNIVTPKTQPEEKSKHYNLHSRGIHGLGLFSSVKSAVKSAVKAAVAVVTPAVQSAAQGIATANAIVSGNWNYERSATLPSWSYGNHESVIKGARSNIVDTPNLQLGAYVGIDMQVYFTLRIKSFALDYAEATITMSASTATRFSANYAASYSNNFRTRLAKYIPAAMFVPPIFYIEPTIEPFVGIDVGVSGNVNIVQILETSNSIVVGLKYDGTLKTIFKNDFLTSKPKWDRTESLSAEAVIEPYLEFQVVVAISPVLSATGTARVGAQGVLTFAPESQSCRLNFNLNLVPKIGAASSIFPIQISGYNIFKGRQVTAQQFALPQKNVYSACWLKPPAETKPPIVNTSVPLPRGSIFGFTKAAIGRVYQGTVAPSRQRPGCDIKRRDISFQVSDVQSEAVTFIGMITTRFAEESVKTQQLSYTMTSSAMYPGKVDFNRSFDPADDDLSRNSSNFEDADREVFDFLSGVIEPNSSNIFLNPLSLKDSCPTFTLSAPEPFVLDSIGATTVPKIRCGGVVSRSNLTDDIIKGKNVFSVYIPDYNGLNITSLKHIGNKECSNNFPKSYMLLRDGVTLCTCNEKENEVSCVSVDGSVCYDLETTGNYQILVIAPEEPMTDRPYCIGVTCWSTEYAAADNIENGKNGSGVGFSASTVAIVGVVAMIVGMLLVVGFMFVRSQFIKPNKTASLNEIESPMQSKNESVEL